MKEVVILLVFLAVGYSNASCANRCGKADFALPCQCNAACKRHGDCCPDYQDVCFTCKNRCGEAFLKTKPCQCNNGCQYHKNCCSDFYGLCGHGASDDQLRDLTETLLELDVNNVGNLIRVDHQGHGMHGDLAPRPYFSHVPPEALSGPTISALIALQDNYVPDVDKYETVSDEEVHELEHFLDVVMATKVMAMAESFLVTRGIFTGNLRNKIKEAWFEFFFRGKSHIEGSCGFEHSFVGEIKKHKVFGFHNWVNFYMQEKAGKLNYEGWNKIMDFGDKGEIIENVFTWLNYPKPYGGMFTGTSPEFELAVYTVCFLARPDRLCPVQMKGKKFNIKTFQWHYEGKTLVASAYPDI